MRALSGRHAADVPNFTVSRRCRSHADPTRRRRSAYTGQQRQSTDSRHWSAASVHRQQTLASSVSPQTADTGQQRQSTDSRHWSAASVHRQQTLASSVSECFMSRRAMPALWSQNYRPSCHGTLPTPLKYRTKASLTPAASRVKLRVSPRLRMSERPATSPRSSGATLL